MKKANWLGCGALVAMMLTGGRAAADEARAAEAPKAVVRSDAPARIGGHLGVATPYLSVSDKTEVLGKQSFFTILNPVGLTFHLGDKWALDLEMVIASSVLRKETTKLIIDPGIIYKGLPVALGLRVAHQVGDRPNVGVIPLVNKGFPIGGVTWFVEAAFPTFVKEGQVTFNAVAHTGLAF